MIHLLTFLLLFFSVNTKDEGTYTDLSEALKRPERVITLDLKKQKLKNVPSEVYTFPNLKVLILDKNKIEEFSDSLYLLTQLEELRFQKNKVTDIPSKIGQLKNLRVFDAGMNEIETVPTSLASCSQLEYLYLNDNYISELAPEFKNLTALKEVNMYGNSLNQEQANRIVDLFPKSVKVYASANCNCD